MTPYRDTPPSADEAALAPFFAAARAGETPPQTALLSAILADAAEVHAARAAPPAPALPAARKPRFGARLLAPIGGWGGLAALGACAALGFWLGLAGNLSLDGTTLTTAAASQTGDAGVDAFFDYASLEQ
ncbi:MAG TPA: hypothetical protein VFN28_06560 [Amaricoccus sp.]|nr:hypothetical protein [Amaricoccus sp.]